MDMRRPAATAAQRAPRSRCTCGRLYWPRKDGKIPRHSPITGWRETPICPRSETPHG